MRLTNNDYLSDALHLKHKTQYEYNNELWQYVKEREDIEEELGISLVTLIKALKEGFVDSLGEYHHFSNLYFSDEEIFDGYEKASFNLKDYGKTWVLTKEELL